MRMRTIVFSGGNPFYRPSRTEQAIAFVIRWLVTAVAVWIAAALIGGIHLGGWQSTLLVALILGVLNAILRPLLVLSTLPGIILTLGIGLILINTLLLGITAWIAGRFDAIDFEVDGFWAAFFGAILISLVSFVITRFVRPERIAREMAR
jgi:putative membrane protein